MTPEPAPDHAPDKRSRPTPPNPGHADWETLCALLGVGQVLDFYEDAGRVTRAVLPAAPARPLATPVSRAVALSLLARGWLARERSRRAAGGRVTSYRLSLRGWYAVRRLRPELAAASPARGPRKMSPAPTEIAAGGDPV